MTGLRRDLRDGWRSLIRERGFSAAAIIMLALGIAATSAVFAVLQAVVLKIPFDRPERIVTIVARDAQDESLPVPFAQFQAWAQASEAFESIACYTLASRVLTGGDAALRVQGEAMSASMFSVLGVQPLLGRTFQEDEPAVIVLSHSFWRSRFNADPNVLGQVMVLDGAPTTVIGVMPAGFEGPRSRPGDLWVPFSSRTTATPGRVLNVSVIGRLRPGVSVYAATSRVGAIPWVTGGAGQWRPVLETARENFLYQEALSQIRIVGGAVALVLLMACVNVVSLLLGRNVARSRELGVRLAIGATRWHVMRQLAAECLILSAAATLLGLVLAYWCVAAITPFIPASFPRIGEVRVDRGVAAFAALVATTIGLVVSVWPAWAASRRDLATALRSGDRGSSRTTGRAHTALVVVEATLGMVVLTGSALLVGAFNRLNPTTPGFELENRTKFTVQLDDARYADRAARVAAVRDIVERLKGEPGVVAASAATSLPLTGSSAVFPVKVTGIEQQGRAPTVFFRAALPDYLSLLGIRILAGRDLSEEDTVTSEPVVVVNEAFIARMLPSTSPLAARVVVDEPDGPVGRRVVGVVRDARLFGSDLRSRPEIFVPYAQSPLRLTSFVVHHAGSDGEVQAAIRRAVSSFDRTLPVDRIQSLSAVAERSVSLPRFFALLMSVFAAIAVALAFVGLYAMTSWTVTQRTRELGVRLALGARPSDIRRMVLRYGAGVGLVGAAAGTACALASSSLVESYLYGFPARPLGLIALVAMSFIAIVTLASYMPAHRAMKIDPQAALRAE
ncbi:ABC transporter permease [soil metagenome]